MLHIKRFSKAICELLFLTMFSIVFVSTVHAETVQYPIQSFINLVGPNAVVAWSDPVSGDLIVIDVYGRRNNNFNLGLPTTIDGKMTVQPLSDGMERVTVEARTRNAICWGFNGNLEPAFGYSPLSVVNQLGPASLGDTQWRIVYAPQPAGQFNPGGEFDQYMGTVTCNGVLRFGSGYADGTPGFAQTRQTGLASTGVPTGCPPERDGDCFPAEKVQFKPRGN